MAQNLIMLRRNKALSAAASADKVRTVGQRRFQRTEGVTSGAFRSYPSASRLNDVSPNPQRRRFNTGAVSQSTGKWSEGSSHE
jgi:hypothetical protein